MKTAGRHARKALNNLRRAGRNSRQSAALAAVVGEVIAARMKMAATGDHGEFARMAPEKIIAFNLAGLAFAQHATRMTAQSTLHATAEWAALGRHAVALASAPNPLQAGFAQIDGAWACWDRMMTQSVVLGAGLARIQQAVTAPIHSAAQANAARLRR